MDKTQYDQAIAKVFGEFSANLRKDTRYPNVRYSMFLCMRDHLQIDLEFKRNKQV